MSEHEDRGGPRGPLGPNPFEALKGRYAPRPTPEATLPASSREAPRIPEPQRGPVVVRREKKGRAGKTVTRVSGLAQRGPELGALSSSLKRALGCGASIEESDVLLQGDQTERATEWLRERGYPDVSIGN